MSRSAILAQLPCRHRLFVSPYVLPHVDCIKMQSLKKARRGTERRRRSGRACWIRDHMTRPHEVALIFATDEEKMPGNNSIRVQGALPLSYANLRSRNRRFAAGFEPAT